MTLPYSVGFIYTLVSIGVAGLTNHSASEGFESFDSVFDFSDRLKTDSKTTLDYAEKIQALFCPQQPICTAEGDRNSTDVLDALPEIIGIGTDVIRMEEMQKIIGACCLPCSCDTKSCKEDGNCCMSKIFGDALQNDPGINFKNATGAFEFLDDVSGSEDENATTLYSECIKASWLSYRDKDDFEIAIDLDIPGYFMITRCFENNANDLDVTKCESPSDFEDEVMAPVTSSVTGRTYWNPYCARCNNDATNILPWATAVKFKTHIAYFVNTSFDYKLFYPDAYDDIPDFIRKTGNIVYIPPLQQDDKLCLRKNILKTCKDSRNQPTDQWLEKACEHVNSPLIIEGAYGRRIGYVNIYCYLCQRQYINPSANGQCRFTEHQSRLVFVGMSALLDFMGSDSSNNALTIKPKQDKCRCDEIYDHHHSLHICRRVYCPAGDFMVKCHCIQPFKKVFGMPVLLTIKLVPDNGHLDTLTNRQITRYHNTLEKILQNISENINVEFVGLMECKTDREDYFLSVVIVRSLPGYDTKETIKPFLDYLDNKRRKIEMFVKQATYSVILTSRIRLWHSHNFTDSSYHLEDLDSALQNHTELFTSDDMKEVYYQQFQVLSPLLYCKQIRLNNTEFKEAGGELTTLRTSKKISITYYHRTSSSTVQVCANQYMKKSATSIGTNVNDSKLYMYILLVFSYSTALM